MLTEYEVCHAGILYVNGLQNATKSLSVTEWLTFVAKDHYDHCTLSSKLFKGNLYVLCTIPLCPSQLTISAIIQVEHTVCRSEYRFVLIHAFEVVLEHCVKGPLLS